VGHVNQKGASGQKAPAAGQKVAPGAKVATKPAQKPSAQKGQVKVTPKAASVKTGKNKKKGQRQQYDLIVTINLVSERRLEGFSFCPSFFPLFAFRDLVATTLIDADAYKRLSVLRAWLGFTLLEFFGSKRCDRSMM